MKTLPFIGSIEPLSAPLSTILPRLGHPLIAHGFKPGTPEAEVDHKRPRIAFVVLFPTPLASEANAP
jgi:hypothetical protein